MSFAHYTWQNPLYFANGARLWADDEGLIRYKQGVVTSDTDGTLLLLADGSVAMTDDFDMGGYHILNLLGIGGDDGQDLVFSEAFDAGDDDSDLLDAYQAVSAGDAIMHQGRLYVKTTSGIETGDGHCLINGSFENLDDSGEPEFWTRVGADGLWERTNMQFKERGHSFSHITPIGGSDDYFKQLVEVAQGEEYHLECFVYCTIYNSGTIYLQAYDETGSAQIDISQLASTTAGWRKLSFFFTIPASCVSISVRFGGTSLVDAAVYYDCVDCIRLRAKDYT